MTAIDAEFEYSWIKMGAPENLSAFCAMRVQ
jgi:hypothetical protein